MKKMYIILFSVLLVLILSIIMVSVFFALPENPVAADDKNKTISYHYMMIGQGTDDTFNTSINKGALQAASDLGAVVETSNVRSSDTFSVEHYFDMALDANVSGIAVQILDANAMLPYLQKAKTQKIPVITFENDSASMMNIPMVGTNRFQAGNESGNLALACKGGSAKVAVILNGFSSPEEQSSKNTMIAGIAEAFKNNPNMKIVVEKRTDGGIYGAEKITSEIIRENPDINLIISTNEMDTLGIIDVIIDYNKVGLIDVIGYGSLPEIVTYIKRNVIYGTVVSDPYKIGYESIHTLVSLSKTGNCSSSINTGVYTYTRSNIDELTVSNKAG